MAKNGTRCRPLYEDQDARISILANDLVLEGRIRFRRLLRASDTNRLPTGRAIRFPAVGARVDLLEETYAPPPSAKGKRGLRAALPVWP